MRIRFLLFVFLTVFSCTANGGTWGAGAFENDDALEWVNRCTRSSEAALIEQTFAEAASADEIDIALGSAVIAAAEVVADVRGRRKGVLPTSLSNWLSLQGGENILRLATTAHAALLRVRDPRVSELRQLWDEERNSKWLDGVDKLIASLRR
jgi:hypothetical protein